MKSKNWDSDSCGCRKGAQTAKIGGAFDVSAALKEAVKTQTENSFQSYMD